MANSTKPRYDNVTIFDEFEDEERKALIKSMIDAGSLMSQLHRHNFFLLWFSDIKTLRTLAAASNPFKALIREIFGQWIPAEDFPGIWAGEVSSLQEPVPEQAAREDSARSKVARDTALGRDGNECVLTKFRVYGLHVSHIVPFKVDNTPKEREWNLFKVFWGEERVDKWREVIMTGKGHEATMDTERVENLITFNLQVHLWWEDCLFALRPISINQDKTSMDVAFHWLPAPEHIKSKASDLVATLEHPFPHGADSFEDSPGKNICLMHGETRSIILSGHIFTITTDDPVHKPLPSKELLDLQWFLRRIVAMRGATDDEDSDFDSDDETNTHLVILFISFTYKRVGRVFFSDSIGEELTRTALQIVTELGDAAPGDKDIIPARSALGLLDMLSQGLPLSQVVAPLLNALGQYFSNPDPNYRHAGTMALAWCRGQILELGGPLAVVLSFLFIGMLTWGVMQCITEML